MTNKRRPSHRILRLSDIQKRWHSMENNAEDITFAGNNNPFNVIRDYPILGKIFMDVNNEADQYRIVHNYYFYGRAINLAEAIDGDFLTPTDIAEDLYEGSSVMNRIKRKKPSPRKIRSWINAKGVYHTKYHIADTITLHRIRDNKGYHYLSKINGKSKYNPPYQKESHDLVLGKYRPQAVVTYNVYRNFINKIYDPNYSNYEKSLKKWYKRKNRSYLQNKLIHDDDRIMKMKRFARYLHDEVVIIYGNSGKITQSAINEVMDYAPSVPHEHNIDLQTYPKRNVSRIVTNINLHKIKYFLNQLKNDIQIAKLNSGTKQREYLAKSHVNLKTANECHLLSKNKINQFKNEIKQLAKDND